MNHSYIIRKSEQIPLNLTQYNQKSTSKRMLTIFKPFRAYKRDLRLHYPIYYPSKFIIALVTQVVIQIEFLIKMFQLLLNSIKQDLSFVEFTSRAVERTVRDLYRSATISFIVVIGFFIFVAFIATFKMLLSFKLSVLDLRLNGPDPVMVKNSIWLQIKFIQNFLGNIFFSNGPFLFFYFIFFWCLFSLEFWKWVWSVRSIWITIVVIFTIDTLIDWILRFCTSTGRYFKHRKVIQFLDVLKIFLGFYAGLFTGFMRFLLSFMFLNITLFRVDKAAIPKWMYQIKNLDFVNNCFLSLVKLLHTHSNPIKRVFMQILMNHAIELRQQKNQNNKNQLDNDNQSNSQRKDSENPFDRNDSFEIEDKLQNRKMSEQKRKKFLKAAYRFQLMVLIARNPLLLSFRKNERLEEEEEDDTSIISKSVR